MVDWGQSGFRPALKRLLETHQQLLQQMVSREQQHPLLIGNCWPCSSSRARLTRSEFPAACPHSGMWESFRPRASGSSGLWPGCLGDTHWVYGPLGQPRLGGAGGLCLWFNPDSPGGHWTVWVLVEVHSNALAATFLELIDNDRNLLLISKADSSQGEWSLRTAWAFINTTAYILHSVEYSPPKPAVG